jgi:hypothetical protein
MERWREGSTLAIRFHRHRKCEDWSVSPFDRQPKIAESILHGAPLEIGIHFTRERTAPCTDHLGQERAPASHELDAGDSALNERELLDAVVNIGLVVHNVLVGIVGHQLTAQGLSTEQYFIKFSACQIPDVFVNVGY